MKTIFTFIILFIFSITNAQIHYKFNHFTTDDGLPSNTIYSITEDKNGTIVLGTDNGLTFFNGNDFKNLNVKDGLFNPYIVSVFNEENKTIWLVNYNGKLQKYENGKIINTSIYSEYYNEIKAVSGKIFMYSMQNRKGNKTYIFSEYLKKNDTFIKKLDTNKTTLIAPPILIQDNKIITIENNFILFKTYKTLIPKEITFIHKIIFRKKDVCILDENYLFITDFNGKVLHKIKLPKPLSENIIYRHDFIIDKQENCWLNIQSKGVFILKNEIWCTINETLELNTEENTNFLYCDTKGKIWIATNENGLYCIPNTKIETIKFKNDENYFNGFANSIDNKSLFISSKFRLYSYKNKVLKILEKSKIEIKIGNYNKTPILYKPKLDSIYFNSKLKLLTVSGKQIIKKNGDDYYVFLGNSKITMFKKNKKISKSLIYKNPKIEKIKKILFYKNEYYFNNSQKINCRSFNTNYVYDKRELKFKIKGYIEDFIFHQDTLFIAVNNSIYKLKNELIIDSIKEINYAKIGTVNKMISIKNNLYLCTGNGLFILSKKGNFVLNKYNFLPNNEVYNMALFNNNLFVATKNGLGKIEDVLLNKKSETPTFKIRYNNTITQNLNLKSNQGLVKLELEIQNFNAIKNQIIQFKLDKSSWVLNPNKFILFQSLSYGKHTIYIRVRDVNSNWIMKKIIVYKSFPFYLKWWFFTLMLLVILSLFYVIYYYQIKKIKNKKQQEILTNNKIVELRQSALSAMMNPHFIFNSLNAIQYFINSNQKEKSSEHLAKLARLVRLFLLQASEPFITLQEEITRLKLYLELEKIRFNNFEFSFLIEKEINVEKIKIPNMILQPFIENAILHGVSHLVEKNGEINLNFTVKNKILIIEIIDNGNGLTNKTTTEKHISKGIAIVKERIEILQQSFPEKVYKITQEIAFPKAIRKGHKVTISISMLE